MIRYNRLQERTRCTQIYFTSFEAEVNRLIFIRSDFLIIPESEGYIKYTRLSYNKCSYEQLQFFNFNVAEPYRIAMILKPDETFF
jgi:hypothetical protein